MGWRDAPVLSADIGAVARVESGGNPNAVSPKGARGVMQVMPGTNTDPGFGVVPARDASETERTRVGEDYLSAMQAKYGREDGLRAYNWGPGNFEKWAKAGRDPAKMPAETRDYVPKVNGGKKMASWRDAPLADDTEALPRVEVRGTSEEGSTVKPPVPKEAPSMLKRATAAAGRLVDQAQTKEGWRAAGNAALKSVVDMPSALVTGAGKFVAPAVGAVQDAVNGDPLGTGNAAIQQGINDFAQDTAQDPNSAGYGVAQVLPEIAATAGPIGRAGAAVAPALRRSLGVMAPTAGDVVANAGYAGGRAALEGKDAPTVVTDAAMGGGGAVAGRAASGVVGGTRTALSKAKQELVERGGLPSAGQIMGGGFESIERGLANTPIVGRMTGAKGGMEDAAKSFSTADVNRALEGTGRRTTAAGEQAVADAVKQVNQGYADIIPQTRMRTSAARGAVRDGIAQSIAGKNPTSAARRIEAYNLIVSETDDLMRSGRFPTGQQVKNVDTRLGQLERDLGEKDPQMARVVRQVKQNLRAALEPIPGAPNSVTRDLQALNRSRAQLYDLEDAARTAGAREGHFTPAESFEARAANGRAPIDDEMTREGRETQIKNRPNSDSAGAIKLGILGAGGVAGIPLGKAALAGLSAGTPAAAVGAGLAGGGLGATILANTRAGRRTLLEGLSGGLPKNSELRRLIQSQQAAALAAQIGREAATGE